MEQYSNLNVHGKIKQKAAQGTESDDVVLYPALSNVASGKADKDLENIEIAGTKEDGKTIVWDATNEQWEYGEAGKVDAVQINGTTIAPTGSGSSRNKVANIQTGTGLTSSNGTINHSNSVDAATAGTSSATSGATAAIPYVTYDAQGHITASGTHTHTINNLAASTIASGELASARLPDATSSSKGAVTLVYATGESGVISVPTEGKMEEFVNSSVGTNTAYFKGTYDVETDLGLAETATQAQVITALNAKTSWKVGGAPTNNDYCFVQFDLSQDPGNVDRYDRYKYSTESTPATWIYEYTLNNSSFTADQWAAINSKISNSTVGTQSVRSVDVRDIVTGPASATVDHIATFNSTNGNIVKDSGFTIATSVPAGAVFTDEHVTSSANHYSPSTASGQDKTASASGATAAWSIDVVKGVTLNTDGKGHVTGISVTSGKIPANPNTDAKTSSSNSSSKLFLVGATTQSTSGQTTYSNRAVYATNGALVANSFNGVGLNGNNNGDITIAGLGTTLLTIPEDSGYTLAGACAKSVDTSISSGSTSTNLPTTAAVTSYISSTLPFSATDVTLADM